MNSKKEGGGGISIAGAEKKERRGNTGEKNSVDCDISPMLDQLDGTSLSMTRQTRTCPLSLSFSSFFGCTII